LEQKALQDDKKTEFFKDKSLYPEISKCKKAITEAEDELQSHLQDIRGALGQGYEKLQYKTLNSCEYLVEVKLKDAKRKLCNNWERYNATKAAVRYYPPQVKESLDVLNRRREELEIESLKAWLHFLGEFNSKYGLFREVITQVSVLDCLLSLSQVAQMEGYCRPTFCDSHKMKIVGARHPMAEAVSGETFVPNDIDLSHDGKKCMIITGPNMGGKSSYIRSMALITIMAQIGCYVPAESAELGIFDAVYTRMGAKDSMATGRSTFLVELAETSDIIKSATDKSLVILDELGRGTSTYDGVAIASATMEYVINKIGCFTMFVTHYPSLGSLEDKYNKQVGNYHMSFIEDSGSDGEQITFLYKLTQGMCAKSYGLNVARLAEIPAEVIQIAGTKAKALEKYLKEKKAQTEHDAVLLEKVKGALDLFADEASSVNSTALVALQNEIGR